MEIFEIIREEDPAKSFELTPVDEFMYENLELAGTWEWEIETDWYSVKIKTPLFCRRLILVIKPDLNDRHSRYLKIGFLRQSGPNEMIFFR
jgi:hypothetical protein